MGLDELREEIKKADMEILEAMRKRLDVAKRIGEYKIGSGKEIRDISVEERVVGRYRDFASANGMDPDVAERVCRAVIEESVAAQASLFQADGRHRKVSVVGGSGKMGGWFSKMLSASGDTVEIIDPASDNGLTLSDASSSDVVIVSVPISVTGDILERLDGICGPDVLIFDLTSLKTPIIPVLKDMASRRKVCSVHPMFGPSAESMYDRNVIICDCGCKVAVSEAVSILGNRGGNIRIMDVDSHDRYMSYVLGLSHAVNIAFFTTLDRSGISFDDMESVASTTFRKNLDTNESVASEDPMLYYEIQHMNASRDEMWALFSEAVEDTKKASKSDDPDRFVDLMNAGRAYFGK